MPTNWTLDFLLPIDDGEGPEAPLSHARIVSELRSRLPAVDGETRHSHAPADPLLPVVTADELPPPPPPQEKNNPEKAINTNNSNSLREHQWCLQNLLQEYLCYS